MTEKTDRMVVEAKLDRIDELLSEVHDLNAEIDDRMAKVNRLQAECEEIMGMDDE